MKKQTQALTVQHKLTAAELRTWAWYRKQGHKPAEIANILKTQREHLRPPRLSWLSDRHSGEEFATWKQSGFTLRAVKHYDQYGDLSYLGEFTNQFEPGCFKRRNTGRHEYKYFMPENTAAEAWKYYRNSGGDSRHQNWLKAQRQAREDWKRAEDWLNNEWCYQWVSVEASRAGVELGSASLGGVESDSDDYGYAMRDGGRYSYFDEVAYDCASEAIAEAKAAIKSRARELRATAAALSRED